MNNNEKFVIQFPHLGYLGKGGGCVDDVFSARIFDSLAKAKINARDTTDCKVLKVSITFVDID